MNDNNQPPICAEDGAQKGVFAMPGAMRVAIGLMTLLLMTAVSSFAADNIRLTSLAEVEVQEVNAKGEKVLVRKPAELVLPGTIVIYTNSYVNAGAKAAERPALTNQVPANMEYLGGSAIGQGTVITFSVDGGKSYAAPDKLMVAGDDGKLRPADPREYTHIRWTFARPVPPGGKGSVEFRARLK